MKAKAKELSSALARLLPILKRSTLPILSCVKLQAALGKLTAFATDIDAFALATCDCEGDLEPVCVDAHHLHFLVRQANDDIELVHKGKRLAVDGNGTAQLGIQDATEFPVWPDLKSGQALGVAPHDLAACIKQVCWAAKTHQQVTVDLWRECVWVKTSEKCVECCATDGKEFAYIKKAGIATDTEFMFPASQAGLFTEALLTGAESVHLSGNWITTQGERFKVAIKQAEGKYVPIQQILQQKQEPVGTFWINLLVDTLQTVRALAKNEPWSECRLHINTETVTVSYRGPNNQFERSLPHKEGKPFKIKLDTERAISVFSHVLPDSKATVSESMIIFYDGDCTYALALMRGDG